jgi:serine protease AprX
MNSNLNKPIDEVRHPYRMAKFIKAQIVLIIIALILPASIGQTTQIRAQALLLNWVEENPEAMVGVIIQKATAAQEVEEWIVQAGGAITKDLYIINSVAAKLPAERVKQAAALPHVRWISLDGPVIETGCKKDCTITDAGKPLGGIDSSRLRNTYNYAIRADRLWQEAPYLSGDGVTIAVVDSGIQANHLDFGQRVVAEVNTGPWFFQYDGYGHGTMVAGLVAGDGMANSGYHIGVAPRANLADVKVTTFSGISTESDVVEGLQWIYENHKRYNIRVVNLSLNAATPQSYHTSPLNAATELLWFNGIVVVTSAGNHGAGALYPPANDPFVITVGAADDRGTPTITDDQVAPFSAFGITVDGISKPDLIAPGRRLVGPLSGEDGELARQHPKNIVSKLYFQMSGTSVAAPVVSGAIALLLQDEPHLTPDQVKYRLMVTANKSWPGYDPLKAGAGYLDIYAAVHGTTTDKANSGLAVSKLLTGGSNIVSSSVNWSSVNWSSVNWSSVNWSSVNWSSDFWEDTVYSKSAAISTDLGHSDEFDDSAIEAQTHVIYLPTITR